MKITNRTILQNDQSSHSKESESDFASTDEQRLQILFAKLEDELLHIEALIEEACSLLSIDNEERELLAHSQVNLRAVQRLCSRKKSD